MKSPTFCSVPINESKTASPASPNTLPTMPRISSRWSPRMLTTAIMPEITPTMGSAPANRLPKPEAIGPHILPSIPAPAPRKFPTFPKTPPTACAGAELTTRPARPIAPCVSPPAFPATQLPPRPARPLACEMPDRISPKAPPVAPSAFAIPPPIPVFSRFPKEPLIPPK